MKELFLLITIILAPEQEHSIFPSQNYTEQFDTKEACEQKLLEEYKFDSTIYTSVELKVNHLQNMYLSINDINAEIHCLRIRSFE